MENVLEPEHLVGVILVCITFVYLAATLTRLHSTDNQIAKTGSARGEYACRKEVKQKEALLVIEEELSDDESDNESDGDLDASKQKKKKKKSKAKSKSSSSKSSTKLLKKSKSPGDLNGSTSMFLSFFPFATLVKSLKRLSTGKAEQANIAVVLTDEKRCDYLIGAIHKRGGTATSKLKTMETWELEYKWAKGDDVAPAAPPASKTRSIKQHRPALKAPPANTPARRAGLSTAKQSTISTARLGCSSFTNSSLDGGAWFANDGA